MCYAECKEQSPQGNVPNLRFPEFSGEWEHVALSEIAARVTRKNKDNASKLPLTISAQYGLVDQISFFNKVVASADMSNYYLLRQGEFAYNKSYSSDYPWGAIKRLDRYPQGALSSLYICFAVNDKVDSDFAVHYFESSKWHREVSNIAGEGARNHGLLNIAVGDFFDTKHRLPSSKEEQKKIAALLNLITERIATQIKIIEKLESLIRGLITDVNSGRIAQCKSVYLRDLLIEQHEKNTNNYEVCSVSVSQGVINQIDYLGRSFAAKEVLHYNVVNCGDIVYTKSPTGDFPYGIVKRSDITKPVAVSPLYGVYRPINDYVGKYLHLYFKSPINAKNYLHKLIQKGAKNTINITNQHFLDNKILIPEKGWLDKIVKFAAAIEIKIATENKVLQTLQQQKDFLLSKMFI